MINEAWVYVLASRSRRIYIGVTRDLQQRWLQHRTGHGSQFAQRYHMNRLVYVERTDRLVDAIRREKELKGWRREKKIALIDRANPSWSDLAADWGWESFLPS